MTTYDTKKGVKALQSALEPGDILVASMGRPESTRLKDKIEEKIFRGFSRALQGDLNHAALYVGGGKVIEMRDQLHARSLKRSLRGLDAVAVRPAASKNERKRAVTRVRELLKEKKKFKYEDTPFLSKVVMANFVRTNDKVPMEERIKAHKLICSNMIGHAYDKIQFHDKKPNSLLTPKDLAHSTKTKVVATYKNRNRVNPKLRKTFIKRSSVSPPANTEGASTYGGQSTPHILLEEIYPLSTHAEEMGRSLARAKHRQKKNGKPVLLDQFGWFSGFAESERIF